MLILAIDGQGDDFIWIGLLTIVAGIIVYILMSFIISVSFGLYANIIEINEKLNKK